MEEDSAAPRPKCIGYWTRQNGEFVKCEGVMGDVFVSVIGLAYLNTRDLGPRQKPTLTDIDTPGDRGIGWRKFIIKKHYRIVGAPIIRTR